MLEFIPLTRKSLQNYTKIIRLITENIDRDCNTGGTVSQMVQLTSSLPDHVSTGSGFFILIGSDSQVQAVAVLVGLRNLSYIWVPESHRRKGYATLLLKSLIHLPIWCSADSTACRVAEKAGWVTSGKQNTDGTTDYFPQTHRPTF